MTIPERLRAPLVGFLASLAVLLPLVGGVLFPAFEGWVMDAMTRLKGTRAEPPSILLCPVDADPGRLSFAVRALHERGAAAVAVRVGDRAELARAILDAGLEPPPILGVSPAVFRTLDPAQQRHAGILAYPVHTGIVRHARPAVREGEREQPTLALRAAQQLLGAGTLLVSARAVRIGDREIAIDHDGLLRIDFRGPPGRFPTLPASEIETAPAERLAGSLVLVDAVNDPYETPFSGRRMSGAELDANIVATLLSDDPLREALLPSVAVLLLIGPLVGLVVGRARRRGVGAALAVLVVLSWPPISVAIFLLTGVHLYVVAPVAAGLLALGATLPWQISRLETELRALEREASAAVRSESFTSWRGGEDTLTIVFVIVDGAATVAARTASAERLRALLEAESGYLVSSLGDWRVAAFKNAARALELALALGADPGDARLTIRAGVDTGLVQVHEENPFGETLTIASRLARLASSPGTRAGIRVSEATERYVAGQAPERHAELGWRRHVPSRGPDAPPPFFAVTPEPEPPAEPLPPPGPEAEARLREREAAGVYDVFFSYSHADREAVERIADRLRRRGIRPWLDRSALEGGQRWQREIEEQIENARAAAIFIGPEGIGRWQEKEALALIDQTAGRPEFRVIPVILEHCVGSPDLPLFLREFQIVDFRAADGDPVEKLIAGIGPHP